MDMPPIRKALAVNAKVDHRALEDIGYELEFLGHSRIEFDPTVELLIWSNETDLLESTLNLFPNLKGIVSWGTDNSHLRCKDELLRRNVQLYSIEGYCTGAVAEYVVLEILSRSRNFTKIQRGERPWGKELRGARIGIIGLGKIGSLIADILDRGFGCEIHYNSREEKCIPGYTFHEIPYTLFGVCEYVVLSTNRSMDALEVSKIPYAPNTFLINITGEEQISVSTCAALIENGDLGGASLDVVQREEHRAFKDTRLTVTSKVAYRTTDAEAMRQLLLRIFAMRISGSSRDIHLVPTCIAITEAEKIATELDVSARIVISPCHEARLLADRIVQSGGQEIIELPLLLGHENLPDRLSARDGMCVAVLKILSARRGGLYFICDSSSIRMLHHIITNLTSAPEEILFQTEVSILKARVAEGCMLHYVN